MRLIDADLLKSSDEMTKVFNNLTDEMYGMLQLIDEQPTVSKMETTTWIPCSERMPETDGTFLVTVKSRRKTRVDICNFNKYAKIESYRWGGQYVSMNVIAWKQLPESYK